MVGQPHGVNAQRPLAVTESAAEERHSEMLRPRHELGRPVMLGVALGRGRRNAERQLQIVSAVRSGVADKKATRK